jgi:hypothetical protein
MVTAAHIAVMGAHIVIATVTATAFPIAGTGARTTRTVTDPVQRSLPSERAVTVLHAFFHQYRLDVPSEIKPPSRLFHVVPILALSSVILLSANAPRPR